LRAIWRRQDGGIQEKIDSQLMKSHKQALVLAFRRGGCLPEKIHDWRIDKRVRGTRISPPEPRDGNFFDLLNPDQS
jgi:hypothetical protein